MSTVEMAKASSPRQKTRRPIEMTPVRREVVSTSEYLRLTKEQPLLISRSRFIPPAMGQDDFGGFEVEYNVPVFKYAAL